MPFEQALAYLKVGRKVRRAVWRWYLELVSPEEQERYLGHREWPWSPKPQIYAMGIGQAVNWLPTADDILAEDYEFVDNLEQVA